MEDNIIQTGGAQESPVDPRQVYVDEVFGALDTPEEFWSPYVVATLLALGVFNQKSQPTCVIESTVRLNAAVQLWVNTPDSIKDSEVIDYLFELKNGKLDVKPEIKKFIKLFSKRFLWVLAKKFDELPNVEGTWLYMGPKLLQEYGSAEESNLVPSNYDLSKAEFIRLDIPDEAFKNAEQFKVERYAFAGREGWIIPEQYKLGIYTSISNSIVGGFDVGDTERQPMVPPGSNKKYGHATLFFGFQSQYVYSAGSWSENYGLTVNLKTINHPKFGKLFAQAKNGEPHTVTLKGLHQFAPDYFSAGNMYRGVAVYDQKFSPELEKRIKMPKLLLEEVTSRVYAILNGKRYWLSPYSSYEDLQKAELIAQVGPDKLPMVSAVEIRKYPWGGVIGKVNLADYIKILTGKL